MNIRTKRIYDPAARNDGIRVLIDRLWPRGISKEKARIDHWFRNIAPSDELRKWYKQDLSKWDEFQKRYELELKGNGALVRELIDLVQAGNVTLLFSSRETEKNNATALKVYLESLIPQ